VKVCGRTDPLAELGNSPTLDSQSGEPGRRPARPARMKVKALHVPGILAPNSLSCRQLRATESNRVEHIDSIVLHVCYGSP